MVWPLLAMQDPYAKNTSVNPRDPSLVTSPARPAPVETAQAVWIVTQSGVSNVYQAMSFASAVLIVLPRYSGVRPIISPPMKIPTRATMTRLYRPVPKPPKVISPSSMLTRGTSTPRGRNESCIALYDPVAPFYVTTAASTDPPTPKRTSFPSMLPPESPSPPSCGGTDFSATSQTARPATNSKTITTSRA